ncbi:hypothetical protein TRAPUB_10833 [Trametes pubescens]|uniref:Uncharacterized protein n=1 Tax=Trametes pubescens TaxID=154538 RepID=A0A1M2VYJ4_TRAPU|nr:hypothetical protein TRAPUB_10833 [Trametes pubescens]
MYSAHFLSASASNASLIRGSSDYSRGTSRENSWVAEDAATSAESSPTPYPHPLSVETDDFRAPNPSYFGDVNPHNSMTSVASDSSEGGGVLTTSPSELTHSVESSASLMRNAVSPARPRPPRTSRSRSRPFSMVSSAGTMHSMRTTQSTTNMLRGPAHSIHSNIQIVLPAPLAPELYPPGRPTDDRISLYAGTPRTTSFYGVSGEGDRRSTADPWLGGASRSQSRVDVRMEREASGSSSRLSSAGPRSASVALPRSSLSRVSSTSSLRDANGDSASMKARRAHSQPPAEAPLPPFPQPAFFAPSRESSPGPPRSPIPPVPRIPSMYGMPSIPYSVPEEQQRRASGEARGRPVRKAPPPQLAALAAMALPAGAAPPVHDPLAQSGYVGNWEEPVDSGSRDFEEQQEQEREQEARARSRSQRRSSKLQKQRSRSRVAGERRAS